MAVAAASTAKTMVVTLIAKDIDHAWYESTRIVGRADGL
jgi:hypothetical protein